MHATIQTDAVIFGGGIAGLWTLDEIRRRGYTAILLEKDSLGAGQTAASQGIIHGGLKYTLAGLLSDSARAIRQMPTVWRQCLCGEREPDLSAAAVRAQSCHLWRTETIGSRVGMIGARAGLRVRPVLLEDDERPDVLRNCPGGVARLDEQVVDPLSVIDTLAARNAEYILKIDTDPDADPDTKFTSNAGGMSVSVHCGAKGLHIAADRVILTAGAGNARLRQALGLPATLMQRRPLHIIIARGANLPILNGHCVDGNRTRVTITSSRDRAGRVVWQVGGQIAEDGVAMNEDELVAHAQLELHAALGGIDLGPDVEWAAYRVDRAEAATARGVRPNDVYVRAENRIITAWPTKFALAPRLAAQIAAELDPPRGLEDPRDSLSGWPRPTTALPPWETTDRWTAARSAQQG